MKIFISYPSEQRRVADEINLALRGQGYDVFFDRDRLPSAGDFHEAIRSDLMESDLMVFLITPQAVKKGKYTMTELAFARKKWPSPEGRVLPVMISPTDIGKIPAYLAAVTIEDPMGNVAAEVVACVNDMFASAGPTKTDTACLEDVVRWCVEAGRMNQSALLETVLFRIREYEIGWEDFRRAIPSPEWWRKELDRLANRLGIGHITRSQPLPESFDSEFATGEDEGGQAVSDAVETYFDAVVRPVDAALQEKDARIRNARLLAVAIAQVEFEILSFALQTANSDNYTKSSQEDGLNPGAFYTWRANRKIDRINRSIIVTQVKAVITDAETAGTALSLPAGWSTEFWKAADQAIDVLMDRSRRKLPEKYAIGRFLKAFFKMRATFVTEIDRLLIGLA